MPLEQSREQINRMIDEAIEYGVTEQEYRLALLVLQYGMNLQEVTDSVRQLFINAYGEDGVIS